MESKIFSLSIPFFFNSLMRSLLFLFKNWDMGRKHQQIISKGRFRRNHAFKNDRGGYSSLYTNSQPVSSYGGPKSAKFYVFLKHLTPGSSVFFFRSNLRILSLALKKVLKPYFSKHPTPEQHFSPKN